MQSLMHANKTDAADRKQAVLDILADRYCRCILHTIINEPKSAARISEEQNIPISTVYRRLQTLHYSKLVQITGSITEEGKKHFLYQGKIKDISIKYDCQTADMCITSKRFL